MWMTDYIKAIKKKLQTEYGFKPSRVVNGEPCFENIPDGDYPMEIQGKLDKVKIIDGTISCCNFQ